MEFDPQWPVILKVGCSIFLGVLVGSSYFQNYVENKRPDNINHPK